MPSARRWSVSRGRKLATTVLAVVAVFIVSASIGAADWLLAALGVALLAAGVALYVVSAMNSRETAYVPGIGHVRGCSPPPASASVGRCELELIVHAPGMDDALVKVRDAGVPVAKWPDVGTNLPILVAIGDRRRVRVLWDNVRSHGAAARDRESEPVDVDLGPDAIDVGIGEILDGYSTDITGPETTAPELAETEFGDAELADAELGDAERPAPESTPVREPEIAPGTQVVELDLLDPQLNGSYPLLDEYFDLDGSGTPYSGPEEQEREEPEEPAAGLSPEAGLSPAAGLAPEVGLSPEIGRSPEPAPAGAASGSGSDRGNEHPSGPETRTGVPVGVAQTGPAAPSEPLERRTATRGRKPSPRPRPRRPLPIENMPAESEPRGSGPSGSGPSGSGPSGAEPGGAGSARSETASPGPDQPDGVRPEPAEADAADGATARPEPVAASARDSSGSGPSSPEAHAASPETAPSSPRTPDSSTDRPVPAASAAAGAAAAVALAARPRPEADRPEADRSTADRSTADQSDADRIEAIGDDLPRAGASTTNGAAATSRGPETAGESPIRSVFLSIGEQPVPVPLRIERVVSVHPAVAAMPDSAVPGGAATTGEVSRAYLAASPPPSAPAGDRPETGTAVLPVANLNRAVAFYRDVLGFTQTHAGPRGVVLAAGDGRILLRRHDGDTTPDARLVHLMLEVPDVGEAYEDLRDRGVEFVHSPHSVSRYEELELRSAAFRDPDGHGIALIRWDVPR